MADRIRYLTAQQLAIVTVIDRLHFRRLGLLQLMRTTRIMGIISIAGLTMLLSIALAQIAAPSQAGILNGHIQVRYDLLETKEDGEAPVSDGRLTTNYYLTLRKPLSPNTNLMSDLSLNSSDTIDQIGTQSNKDWRFNVYATGSRYNFTGRISRTDSVRSSRLLNAESRGAQTSYNASLLWREPAYPVVNLQYIHSATDNSSRGSSLDFTNTTWRLGSYYDLAPLRFTYDRSKRTLHNPGQQSSHTTIERSAVQMNHAFMQGLIVTSELSRYSTEFDLPSRSSSNSTNRGLIRLTMLPTQSVIASIDLTKQSTDQQSTRQLQQTDYRTLAFNIRAQVIPQLSLDFTDQRQKQTSKLINSRTESDSRSWNLGINGQLSERSSINGSFSGSSFDVGIIGNRTRQNSSVLSLLTDLTRTTDLTANIGQETACIGVNAKHTNKFAGISIRDYTSHTLSMGTSVRWSENTSPLLDGSRSRQTSNSINIDALWLPTQRVGINLGLIYQANNGVNSSRFFAPEFNFRWQVDSRTNLVLGYNLNRVNIRDQTSLLDIIQRNNGLTFRIDRSFLDGSSMNLAYDFQRTNIGSLEWQKQFRFYYLRRL